MKSSSKMAKAKTLFITGTDTGVGKTLLTGLLLVHLRRQGRRAWAIKPFCTGGRNDARLLSRLQEGELSLKEINPYYFPEPAAPLVAARQHGQNITLKCLLRHVEALRLRCEILLVEGIGGVLAPLGEGYTVADFMARLGGGVLVAAPNQIGVINHALLTVGAIQHLGIKDVTTVLMGRSRRGLAPRTHAAILAEFLGQERVLRLPFWGAGASRVEAIKNISKKFNKTLALATRSVRV